MSDDLDELDVALRRAMAALDGGVPAGYFDALPERTLARLDDPAIDELPDEPGRLRAVQVRPPPAEVDRRHEEEEEEEDDDDDDDGALYSSQIMPAIELPDPAEPEAVIAVPAAAAVEDLAARPASTGATGPVEAPGGAVVSISAGSRRRSRMRVAIAGIGVAAVAAVAVIYLAAGNPGRRMERPATSTGERSAPKTTAAAGSPGAGSGSAVAAGSAAITGPGSAAIAPPATGSAAQGSGFAVMPEPPGKPSVPPVKRPGKVKLPTKGSGSKLDAELPDGITKRGVGKKPTSDRPRSDRAALSRGDIERAMTAVAGQARACFAGTRGTAALRVTVAPSGRIEQIVVIGAFAGTPTGACVARAVQAAAFPVWNGPSQSFDYSYLVSD
jgi:hypothetical protein